MEEKEVFWGYSSSEGTGGPHPGGEVSDQQLVRWAQKGDQRAFTELYARYRRKIFSYLYRFTGNRAAAEDLTQETFLRVVRSLHRYRPTGSVGGWIYRIAGNLALNALRDRPKIEEISLDEPLELDEDSVDRLSAIPSADPQPDEQAASREKEMVIQQALKKIPPVYREVVILCDIEGYAYQEAADLLDCSINTVASRLSRGRSQLAGLLGYLRKEEA